MRRTASVLNMALTPETEERTERGARLRRLSTRTQAYRAGQVVEVIRVPQVNEEISKSPPFQKPSCAAMMHVCLFFALLFCTAPARN